MNSPDRSEVNAAIEALEGKVERRIATFDRKVDALIERMDRFEERMTRFEERMTRFEERMTRFEERLARFEERMTRIEERMTGFENRLGTAETDIRSLRSTIITTAIASVLAIVIGISALNSSMQTNMLNAFSSGQDHAAMQAQLKREMDAITRERAALQERWRKQDAEMKKRDDENAALRAELSRVTAARPEKL